jgi:N-acetylglucosaminyldiphosphoundecaprenol N-acetyl-beta-D-mannosaminyltransferase
MSREGLARVPEPADDRDQGPGAGAPTAHACARSSSRTYVNGVRIDPVTPAEFLSTVRSFLACGESHLLHFCAAHPTVEARQDAAYRDLLNRGDLNLADGMPVAWAARTRGAPTLRLPGTDAMNLVTSWGVERGMRHYLYGATDDTLALLRRNMEEANPGVRIVGAESPPFRPISDAELDATAARIAASNADAVWIGLGAPKQDVIGDRLRERGAAPTLFAVGAAFDFIAGTKRRAPGWMSRIGLEWLFRLASEPGRLWKRYLVGNTRFVVGVASDRVRRRPA